MELLCTIAGTSMVSVAMTLGVVYGIRSMRLGTASPKQLSLQTPQPLEVWKVFGLGEVLIQEVDEQRGVVAVTPEEGDERKVWLSLIQLQSRGVMLHHSNGSGRSLDRVRRMRDRNS